MKRSQTILFSADGYILARSEPCFVDMIFRKSKPRDSSENNYYVAKSENDGTIVDFVLAPPSSQIVPLAGDHPGRAILRKVGDKLPFAARLSEKNIIVKSSYDELVANLSRGEFGCYIGANPFFQLRVANSVGDEELELVALSSALRFLWHRLPGLERRWLKNTIVSNEAREKMSKIFDGIGLDESKLLDALVGKKVYRIDVVDYAQDLNTTRRSFDFGADVVSIHYRDGRSDHANPGADLLAVIAPEYFFALPRPEGEFSGVKVFAVAARPVTRTEVAEYEGRGISLLSVNDAYGAKGFETILSEVASSVYNEARLKSLVK